MSNGQIQLSPEGNAIAQKVAALTGVQAITPHARMRDSAAAPRGDATTDGASTPPTWALGVILNRTGCYLLPLEGADFTDVRLGVSLHVVDGLVAGCALVGRRHGARVWQIEYASESACEEDAEHIRAALASWGAGAEPTHILTLGATSVTNFDARTGAPIPTEGPSVG